MKTKYEKLYGVKVNHFPNERENIKEKLKLVSKKLNEIHSQHKPYTYENQCEIHELTQAYTWCKKILEDIES